MATAIRGRSVDTDHPLFVIAELGLNHGGDLRRALRMVDASADAGASAIKVQSFRADQLVASSCPAPAHVDAPSLRSFFRRFELDRRAHAAIAARAHQRGLAFVATPFDPDWVSFLETVGCDAYKIASGDLTHHGLIRRAAATGKPVLLSTGMSGLEEIQSAVDQVQHAGHTLVVVLHCVSAYPVPSGEENLRAVAVLSRTLGVTVGLSDHSSEPLSVPLAVALGATVYERHVALDDTADQIERAVSSTPREIARIVQIAERARRVLGDGKKVCAGAEAANRISSRRSLHAARDLGVGEVLDPSSIVTLRPGTGLDPRLLPQIVGRRMARDVAEGHPLRENDLVPVVEGAFSDVA